MDKNGSLPSALSHVPQERWKALSQTRIFFGHQSVGQNIVEGLKEIAGQHPAIRLNIQETVNPDDFGLPIFAHVTIGRNTDPLSKIEHFREILDSGLGQVLDIAIFKFCYVDITRKTDVEALLVQYDEVIVSIAKKFPELKVITFTAPLTAMPKGMKPLIKNLLERFETLKQDNIQRKRLNERMLAKYGNSVFDLADIEATRPNGTKAGFKKGDISFPLLDPSYTDDGGHLNRMGRQIVAAELLLFLLALTKS